MSNNLKQPIGLSRILDGLINFLNEEMVLASRKDGFLKEMSSRFQDKVLPTEAIFEQLEALVESDPQFIIDETRRFLESQYSITKLFGLGVNRRSGKEIRLKDRLTEISDIYESASIFQMAAFLNSKQKAPYRNLIEPKMIFGQLKTLGLNKREVEMLRLIRNANSHSCKIEKPFLLDSEGNRILIKEIEDIHAKIEDILLWWVLFVIFSLWYLPKFGIIVLVAIWSSMKHNDGAWGTLSEGLTTLYGDFNQEINAEKNMSKSGTDITNNHYYYQNLNRDIRKNKILKANYNRKVDKLLWNNILLVLNGLESQFSEVQKQIVDTREKLNNENDVNIIQYISEKLSAITKNIADSRDYLTSNPDALWNILSRRQRMSKFKPK